MQSCLHQRTDYGQPLNRHRVYILLVREELMVRAARKDFPKFCNEICDLLKHDPDVAWCLCPTFLSNPMRNSNC